jgi:hypothetical protein
MTEGIKLTLVIRRQGEWTEDDINLLFARVEKHLGITRSPGWPKEFILVNEFNHDELKKVFGHSNFDVRVMEEDEYRRKLEQRPDA